MVRPTGIVTFALPANLNRRVQSDSDIGELEIIGRWVGTVFVQVLFVGLFVEIDTPPRLYRVFTSAFPAIALAAHGRRLATGGGPSHRPVSEDMFDFVWPTRDAAPWAGSHVFS